VDQLIPAGIDALQEYLGEDALDEVLLGREISVEQRLGDAEPLSQLPRLPVETDLGEIADGARQDLLLAIGGGKPAAAARLRRLEFRRGRAAALCERQSVGSGMRKARERIRPIDK